MSLSIQKQLHGSQSPTKPPDLDEETRKQFEELARNFAEQDTIEDIVNWNEYLCEQLGDEHLVDKYNEWSEEYFTPQPLMDEIIECKSILVSELLLFLEDADWNVGNKSLEYVSSTMLYGGRLSNTGLFSLGTFEKFWLTVRLDMWAISPGKRNLQLRNLGRVAHGQPGGVLGLRYKPIGDDSTMNTILFFPIGNILYTERIGSGSLTHATWVNNAEWIDTPYVLAVGIQKNGRTELCGDKKTGAQFYLIHNLAPNGELCHIPTEDSDDDVGDIILCRKPPPYTVARVKKLSREGFLNRDIIHVALHGEIDLEPLSCSTPEVVETRTTKLEHGECTRFGLFS